MRLHCRLPTATRPFKHRPHRTTIVWIKLTQAHGMDQLRPPVLSLLIDISDPSDR